MTKGNIKLLTGIESDTRFLQISTPIQPGNSGGPLVDESGTLVGVATSQLGLAYAGATGVLPQNVNFAIRSSVVELFLQSRGIPYQTAASIGPTISTADLADKVTPAVVQVLCHGSSKPQEAPHPSETAPASGGPSTRSTIERVFQSINNYDVIGFDYRSVKNVSEYQCRAACDGDRYCKATTYNKKARYCFLKTGAALIVRNYDASASIAGELSSQVMMSTFTIVSGRDSVGGDYARMRNTTFVACYAACEQDSQCKAFSYVRRKKQCWLKSALGQTLREPGVELGVR